jgi:carbon-monoxide dehydrogenase large subunit
VAAASIELRSKLLAIAADAIEAAVEDLDIDDGRVFVRGTATTGMSFAELGQLAYIGHDMLPPGTTPGLEASHRYKAPPFTFSNACHICTCEVDVDTGRVTILRYFVSEDCGRMINPKVVEGQIFGGVVQGLGGVLYEHMVYDDDGNPRTSTFVDYLLPTACEVPTIEIGHIESPPVIRWASREWERVVRLHHLPRSSTPSRTRWRPSASRSPVRRWARCRSSI